MHAVLKLDREKEEAKMGFGRKNGRFLECP
jgi:hypothetical protein